MPPAVAGFRTYSATCAGEMGGLNGVELGPGGLVLGAF